MGYDSSNDRAFQYRYWKIKKYGISDNVIVMDDDYFIGNKLKKDDFFYVDNGKVLPVIPTNIFIKLNKEYVDNNLKINKEYVDNNLKIFKSKAEKSKEEQNGDIFSYTKFLSLSFILNIFNISMNSITFIPDFTHNALPLNLYEIEEAYYIIFNSIHKYPTLDAPYRHMNSIQFQIFMLSYCFLKYHRRINNIPHKYIPLYETISLNDIYSLFCINKGPQKYTFLNYNNVKIVLEYLFPNPTPYEIINYSFVNISFYVSYILNMKLKRNIRIHEIMIKEFIVILLIIIILIIVIYIKFYFINKRN